MIEWQQNIWCFYIIVIFLNSWSADLYKHIHFYIKFLFPADRSKPNLWNLSWVNMDYYCFMCKCIRFQIYFIIEIFWHRSRLTYKMLLFAYPQSPESDSHSQPPDSPSLSTKARSPPGRQTQTNWPSCLVLTCRKTPISSSNSILQDKWSFYQSYVNLIRLNFFLRL